MRRGLAHVLLFARYPVPGQAKTRLIPELGEKTAARVHRRMTEHAVSVVRSMLAPGALDATVCFTGASRKDFRAWLGPDLNYARQISGGLGERLSRAFEAAFRAGAQRVVAIGSDAPDMTAPVLRKAVDALLTCDAVMGPAADGGYYLIGMRHLVPEVFESIDWGTERVYAQTVDALRRAGLSFAELEVLNDIDRPEDLPLIRNRPAFMDDFSGKPAISVIIPALNEAEAIGRTLEKVRQADGVEIIVSDGGSADSTGEIAATAGASVMVVPGGRAAQMNGAAGEAKGSILLFLHADTLLPDCYDRLIREALDDPSTVAGAFRFKTDGSGAAMRFVEWAANLRSSFLRMPYGDQALFMEKRVFMEERGFANMPVMEDFEFVRRLRSRGPVVTLTESAVTSARRWQRLGVLRTAFRNQCMIAGFLAGAAPENLSRLYRRSS